MRRMWWCSPGWTRRVIYTCHAYAYGGKKVYTYTLKTTFETETWKLKTSWLVARKTFRKLRITRSHRDRSGRQRLRPWTYRAAISAYKCKTLVETHSRRETDAVFQVNLFPWQSALQSAERRVPNVFADLFATPNLHFDVLRRSHTLTPAIFFASHSAARSDYISVATYFHPKLLSQHYTQRKVIVGRAWANGRICRASHGVLNISARNAQLWCHINTVIKSYARARAMRCSVEKVY